MVVVALLGLGELLLVQLRLVVVLVRVVLVLILLVRVVERRVVVVLLVLLLLAAVVPVVVVPEEKKVSPEALSLHKSSYESYWWAQQEIFFDRCRIRGKPNLFMTVAPAEWKFPLQEYIFGGWKEAGRLSDVQARMASQMY